MHDDISDRLLERYCAGDCTPEERTAVEAWAAEDSSHAEELALLVMGWRVADNAARPAERPDVGAAWESVQARTGVGSTSRRVLQVVPSLGQPPARWRRALRPAAAIAAAAVLAVGATTLSRHRAAGGADVAQVDRTPLRDIVTRRGQRAALNLPDGSRVVLGAESRLTIPRTYRTEAGPRDVFLTGEAFFEVAHDKARPFRVHAANGIAQDLGTEFVVRAYPETKGVEVVVAHGAVALSAADSQHSRSRPLLTLLPGEYGRLDSSGTATLTRGVSVASYTGWVNGDLIFDNTPMREVVQRLERWYDIDVRLTDSSLAPRRLTVSFRGESAAEALDHVALSFGARVEWHGRVAVLRAGGR